MRVLLDTNVWSRLIDKGAGEDFYRYAKNANLDVLIAPATLMELLASPNPESRRMRVRVVCRSRWTRLPTEAESEANEVVSEIRRLRPAWLRPKPDLYRLAHLHELWQNVKWREARAAEPYLIEEATAGMDAYVRRMMILSQREQKRLREGTDYLTYPTDISKRLSEPVEVVPDRNPEKRMIALGWRRGTSCQGWRVQLAMVIDHALFGAGAHPGEPFADWIGIYVDLHKLRMQRRDLGSMLLYEVEPSAMKRNWLRWAVDFTQPAMRIGSGNPGDNQLSAYLFDADIFITADKRFAQILRELRPVSPVTFAMPKYLNPSAEDLTHAIEGLTAS
ncbi:hypothetical protein [Sphaerisporangium corydalis]|uniref:DUF4935 domain-containing protein n=1 Tax=Sphaerisporangium corydalis TaxID=1441875 RepID=A0ABV9E9T4_9ACTN|nr:hypothetical protein [Sphaerisporangium corydalis]